MYQEDLTEIYIHLKDVLKQLSQAPIDEEFSDDRLLKHMLKLKQILEHDPIDTQSKTLLSLIHQISNSIGQIINSRYNLRVRQSIDLQNTSVDSVNFFDDNLMQNTSSTNSDICLSAKEVFSKDRDDTNEKLIKSLTITPPATETNINKYNHVKQGKRLSKHITAVLNKWYNDNIENPYLTKEDISCLKKETNLQESQIKNWASNKRRKRKENKISPELYQILK